MKRTILLFLWSMCFCLISCATTGPSVDVGKTWDEAYIRIPGLLPVAKEHREKYFAEMLKGKKYPTVLYFHGAGGLNSPESRGDFDVLEKLNIAVVAPHSYARERPRNDMGDAGLAIATEIFYLRDEEITLALERVRQLTWVDQSNIFIWGHSEGGMVVAAYPGAICNGRILTGTGCQWGFRAKEPVLALQAKNDPYKGVWKIPSSGEPTTCKWMGGWCKQSDLY